MWQLKNFDDVVFTLDKGVRFLPGKRCVVSESGVVASLSENSYRFLLLLVTGETDKQEIINQVWHEQRGSVTDSSYYGQIYILRKAFELVGLSGELIKTLPRKGVIYLGKVVQESKPEGDDNDASIAEDAKLQEPQLQETTATAMIHYEENKVIPAEKSTTVEWYNSPHWNKLISILAVLAVCWLTTLILTVYYFILH
ncbi:winged helix-turn-helix domain-containing protein [Serratia rubidaea]|uniref:winged helix-turn-helix domain-containing protein n=1 Tax=Serratia rubidaea TaxID=61652 RepID=UPI0024323AA0|nr:transcriptional regulator [Serratia rubidaea]MCR0999492.1 transcriptional regulator [Serratia rubidaea]